MDERGSEASDRPSRIGTSSDGPRGSVACAPQMPYVSGDARARSRATVAPLPVCLSTTTTRLARTDAA